MSGIARPRIALARAMEDHQLQAPRGDSAKQTYLKPASFPETFETNTPDTISSKGYSTSSSSATTQGSTGTSLTSISSRGYSIASVKHHIVQKASELLQHTIFNSSPSPTPTDGSHPQVVRPSSSAQGGSLGPRLSFASESGIIDGDLTVKARALQRFQGPSPPQTPQSFTETNLLSPASHIQLPDVSRLDLPRLRPKLLSPQRSVLDRHRLPISPQNLTMSGDRSGSDRDSFESALSAAELSAAYNGSHTRHRQRFVTPDGERKRLCKAAPAPISVTHLEDAVSSRWKNLKRADSICSSRYASSSITAESARSSPYSERGPPLGRSRSFPLPYISSDSRKSQAASSYTSERSSQLGYHHSDRQFSVSSCDSKSVPSISPRASTVYTTAEEIPHPAVYVKAATMSLAPPAISNGLISLPEPQARHSIYASSSTTVAPPETYLHHWLIVLQPSKQVSDAASSVGTLMLPLRASLEEQKASLAQECGLNAEEVASVRLALR